MITRPHIAIGCHTEEISVGDGCSTVLITVPYLRTGPARSKMGLSADAMARDPNTGEIIFGEKEKETNGK